MKKHIVLLFLILSFSENFFGMDVQQQFIEACRKGDIKLVASLLKNGARADIPEKYGHWMLAKAAYEDNMELAKLLLEKDAPINAQDGAGVTALHEACQEGNVEMVKFLLKEGASVEIKNVHSGELPLHLALSEFCLRCSEEEVYDEKNKIILLLLEAGSRIDVQTKYGFCALHYATNISNDQKAYERLRLLLRNFEIIPSSWVPEQKTLTLKEWCLIKILSLHRDPELLNSLPNVQKQINERRLSFIKYCLSLKECTDDTPRDRAIDKMRGNKNFETVSYIDKVLAASSYEEFLKL